MFASQLLRILQTLPADAKYEPRIIDAPELKVRGTEKHSKDADLLSFNTKELLHSEDRRKVADSLVLDTRERDAFLNSPELEHAKVVCDLIINDNCGTRVSSTKDDPSEIFYHSNRIEKYTDALTSDEEDTDGLWNPPDLECPLIMDEYSNPNEHESRVSRVSSAPFVTSESFHADKNLYTDKNVLEEYELPELMVCYKEINYHVVKDILVDNGIHVEDKVLIDRHSGISAGQPLSLPSNGHATNGTPGGLDFELLVHRESRASPKLDAEKHQSEEEKGSMTSAINESESLFMEVEENKRGPNPEIMRRGTEKNTTNKRENDCLFEESIITSALPLNKFGTRSFLRSFMDSFDDNDGEIVVQHLNQNMNPSSQILDMDSEGEDSDQGSTENNLIYNSKVENGIITFDFYSSEPSVAENNRTSDQIIEKSSGTSGVLNHNDPNSNNPHAGLVVLHAEIEANHQESVLDLGFRDSNNPFIVDEVRRPVMDRSSVNIQQESLLDNTEVHKNNPFVEVQSNTTNVSTAETRPTTMGNQKKDNIFNPFKTDENTEPPKGMKGNSSNNPFVVSEVQNAKMDNSSESNHHPPLLSSKIAKNSNPFASSEVQSSSIQGSIEKSHQQPEVKQKKGNSNNPFAISEIETAEIRTCPNVNTEIVQVDSFEASFSAVSGQIPDSGPVTSSGSTSVGSDSSSTSMRSFAFPVLQCEWNDSPEKFGKAKKGDFSKQRGRWKQGAWRALCCSGRLTG